MVTITPETDMGFPTWYRNQIVAAASLEELRLTLRDLLPMSGQGLEDTAEWSEETFQEWLRQLPEILKSDRALTDNEVDRFGWLVVPLIIFLTTIAAAAVPELTWGECFLKLCAEGVFEMGDDAAYHIADANYAQALLNLIEPEESEDE